VLARISSVLGGHRVRFVQTGLVLLAWLVGEAVVRATGAPVSGGIVGLFLVLVLLGTGRLSLSSVKGADWLLAEMALFFVPAVLAVLDHPELGGLFALKLLVVILGSTVAVMTVTALTVELLVGRGATR
jgi:holin-like protein